MVSAVPFELIPVLTELPVFDSGMYLILFVFSVRITMRTKRSQWTFSAKVRSPTFRLNSSLITPGFLCGHFHHAGPHYNLDGCVTH